MAECRSVGKSAAEKVIPKCMDIPPAEIVKKMVSLPVKTERRIFGNASPAPEPSEAFNAREYVAASRVLGKQFTLAVICLNEERNAPRFIDLVMKHPAIGRVVAIDGGSTDGTVKLLSGAGAEVYVHPYLKEYHEQQAMQRNISCSYIKDGTPTLIMDFDECFSDELSKHLEYLAGNCPEYGLLSRRTFKYFDDTKNPDKQIKDFPDWQPRLYKWNKRFKFVNGAHHWTLNCPEPIKIDKPIIHFECEGKDRAQIEAQWARMMDGVRNNSK
jgi:hypothetical protein